MNKNCIFVLLSNIMLKSNTYTLLNHTNVGKIDHNCHTTMKKVL